MFWRGYSKVLAEPGSAELASTGPNSSEHVLKSFGKSVQKRRSLKCSIWSYREKVQAGAEASGESLAEAPNDSPEVLTSAGVDSPESRMQKAKMAITSSSSPQMIH